MIYATVNLTIEDYISKCDKKILLYRGDKNVEIRFVMKGNKFTVLDSTYAQLIIKRPSAVSVFSEPALIQNDTVVLTITEDMVDELKEIGEYTFQIRLYDTDMNARATLPPCDSCLIIEKPIATEGESAVNLAVVNDSVVMLADASASEEDVFTEDNEYNRTIWVDGDLITDTRLNKIEDALYYINQKGGSGGGGATAPYISTELPETVLVGTGENFDLYLDFNSPNMGKGTLKVFINDVEAVSTRIDQGETTTPISGDLFIKGTNRLVVYVLDRVGVMSNSLTFYVRYGSTELTSDFDVYSSYAYGETVRYYFTPTALDTSLKLTFYMVIDGEIQQGVECTSDTRGYFTFPSNLTPDNHYCEAYVLDSNGVKSNTLKFNLIILGENTLVVASDTKEVSVEEGEQLVLDYKVYMNNNNSFITKTYVDGDLVNTGECGLDFNYYRTSSLTEGDHTIKIEVWDVTETYSDYVLWDITITPSTFAMLQPVNAGAMFIATAVNKSNADERRDEFIGKDQEGNEIVGELFNFSFDSDSGWVNDELIISGNSHVEIPIQPLANNARYGFTLDIEFTSKQIGAEDAEVLTLWNDEKNCGIRITTENLILRSAEGNECNLYFTDNERTNVMFIIDRQERKAKIYLNGVMCEAFHLSDYSIDGVTYLEDFTVNSNVILGGYYKAGYTKIRNLRIYNVALTTSEIINNWISCEIEKSKQKELVEFQKGNDLPTLYIYCDFSGLGKDDKKPCRIVYNSTDEEKYGKSFNLDHKQSTCQYQGTSSMAYPIKNYRLNLRDENGDKWYYDFPDSQPECRFTLKADFMNSCHAHNTGMAKFINDNLYNYNLTDEKSMNPFKWYHIQNGGKIDDFREAINGFPCRLILVNDGETPLNEGQNEPTPGNTKDMGIFNFNNDKDATTTLGFDSDIFPNCASYEVTANSDTSAGAFMSYKYEVHMPEDTLVTRRFPLDGATNIPFEFDATVSIVTFYASGYLSQQTYNKTSGIINNIPTDALSVTFTFATRPTYGKFGDKRIQFVLPEEGVTYPTTIAFDESEVLEYIKQSFELRYPDEDDVPEGWGFMGALEDKHVIDYYMSGSSMSTTYMWHTAFDTTTISFNGGNLSNWIIECNGKQLMNQPSVVTIEITDPSRPIRFQNASSWESIRINGVTYYKGDAQASLINKAPYTKQTLIEGTGLKALIDWVDNCTDEEFVSDFEQHFHKDYTLRYYALVVLIGAVDNLGKNMMLDTADNKIFFPRFYDIDTILSYDNSGDITFDVDIEMEQGYWNTSSSRLWTRIRELMHDDVVAIYNNMRQNGVSYDKIMQYMYGEQISKIPQTYYNKDYDVKYAPFEDSYIGMAHGNGYEHMKRWLKNRFIFCDTLFDYAPSYNNDVLTIRANTTEPMTIYIETYTPVYQHMSWYNGQMDKKKIDGKIAVEFTGTAMAATDQEVLIYGGSNIKSIKGISSMNPNQMLIGSATRLVELDVSNSPLLEDINSNQANLSPHSYLTKLNISNCPLLGGNLRINNSNLIQEIDASGTAISGVIFPSKMRNLLRVSFANCENLTSLDLSSWDTKNVTSMGSMFQNCNSLTSINMSGWDTGNVTDMSRMFYNCNKLTSIDLSGWDTGNVTNMSYMFYMCTSLTSVDLSGFETGKVTNMYSMFYSCNKLTSIDLSGWDVGEVTNMYGMFQKCTGLTSVDLSGWDTGNVTNMRYMFHDCNNLTSLDLSGWDTKNVTIISSMFYNCNKLTSIDLSGWDTGNFNDMNSMFYGCSNLTQLDVSDWDTGNVVNMVSAFQYCTNLISLDLSGWDVGNVTSMGSMFQNCTGLTSLDLSGWDTGNVLNISSMFRSCTNLTSLDVSGWDTGDVTSMGSMFRGCTNLTSLDVSGWNTDKVTDMAYVFNDCTNLISLDLSGWNTGNVTNMTSMFHGCTNLASLNVSGWNVGKVTIMGSMFQNCINLTSLDVSGWDTAKVIDMLSMFRGCSSLTSLDLSGWVMTNSTSKAYMLTGCNNLNLIHANDCSITTLTKISEELPTRTETSYGYLGASEVTDELTTSLLSKYWKLANGLIVASYQATDEAYTPTFNSEITQHFTNLISDGLYSHIIVLPEDFTSCSFSGGSAVTAIDYLKVTTKVTSMNSIFSGCNNLTSLNLSAFVTSNVTNMGAMLYNCSKLTSLDLSGFDTSKVTSMAEMFYGCSGLTSLDVSGFDTSNVTGMYGMFRDCTNLPSLDLSGFDTSNVTSMNDMFSGCSGLTSLDVSGFDTSNVANMSSVFYGCSNLTSLDVSGFDTSNVTSMWSMFQNCSKLTSLDVSGFETSKITNMNNIFNGCNSLTSLDLSGLETGNVTTMTNTFRDCTNLTSLDLSGFDTSNVTSMAAMFSGCNNLKVLNANICTVDTLTKISGQLPARTETSYGYLGASEVTDELTTSLLSKYWKVMNGLIVASYQATNNDFTPAFNSGYTFSKDVYEISDGLYNVTLASLEDFTSCSFSGGSAVTAINYLKVTSNVTGMANMFSGCNKLTSLDVSGFDTSKVTNMSSMFYNCKSLTSLDVSGFDTSNVTGMAAMFYGCSGLTSLDVSGFDTSNVTNMTNMFLGCNSLSSIDLSGWDTGKVNNMSYMFHNCINLTSLDLSGFDTSDVNTMANMFYNCTNLTSLDLSGFDTSNVTNMSSMFYNCNKLTSLDVSGFNTSNVTNMGSMFYGCSGLTSLDLSGFDTSKVTTMANMFQHCSNLTSLDLSGLDTSNVTSMGVMFSGCSGLTSLDLSGFDTSNVADMSNMFQNCNSLTSLDVSGFDTSNATNMGGMFSGCTGLTSLDLSGLDTSNVTNTGSMFSGCNSLTSLDVSGFDTSKVTNMNSMFQNCNQLTSLDISGFDTSNVTDMSSMISGCSNLTSLDVSGLDTSNVTTMYYMISGCSNLTSLDLSGWDTGDVTNMYGMFYSCNKLTSLDLSGFDTSNVTNMYGMFYGCNNLTSLDLSGFDTSNVITMAAMFYGCSNLSSIDLSGFDTSNVTNMGSMFQNCNKLTSLDISGFDTNKVTNMGSMFQNCINLTSLDSPKNISTSLNVSTTSLDITSLLDIIENLAVISITYTLTLGSTLRAKLTEEQIAVAVNKGWTVA